MTAPTPPSATGEASEIALAIDTLGNLVGTYDSDEQIDVLRSSFSAIRTAARAEAIRECIKVAQDYIDKRQPELSAGKIPATYTTAGAIVVRDRLHMLLAEPARAKGEGE